MWETLFKRYWQVAIMKKSPENTPYSPFLGIIVSCLFFLLITFQWYLANAKQGFKPGLTLLAGFTLLCSYYLYTYVLLKIYRKAHRALQTLTALLVSHLIIHLFAFPLLVVTPLFADTAINKSILFFVATLYLILTLILTIWQFLVTIYIYKQALEVDYLIATLASVGLFACNILTVSLWQ